MSDLSEEELQELYAWIDEIPLTRQKKNITRDFSDGVLAAEVVHHFLPKLVDLHNYSPANAVQQKIINWRTFNGKVLSKLNLSIPEDLLQGAANGKPGVIEFILINIRSKIEHFLETKVARNNFSSESLHLPDPLSNYQTMSSHQPWGNDVRHPGPALPLAEQGTSLMNRTCPTGSIHASKPPLLPSRIPVSSKNKERNLSLSQETDSGSGKLLPPLVPNRQEAQILRRRHTQYSEKVAANGKGRDSSAKYKLRLAEKDQRLLETHEYIQFLQMKLTRYEHLVHVKDMKIEELKRELETTKIGKRQALPYHQKLRDSKFL